MTEIELGGPVPAGAQTMLRRAVRAVVREGGRYLLVHSAEVGDLKFPGGGVEPGETPEEALAREVREECGTTLERVGELVVRVREARPDRDRPEEFFLMVSDYYLCKTAAGSCAQALDDYEKALGFTPAWMGLGEALARNRALDLPGNPRRPPWLAREILVMERLLALYPATAR